MYFLIALVLLFATCALETENIALGKPTWQEHPWPNLFYYSGDNAVDGLNTNRSLPGGQCSMSSNGQYTATWRVDLGNVFSISHINIYYRTDNQPIPTVFARRMAGFYLFVSNTTSKETGHICFHENQTKQEMILEDISINCSVSGRYVIYYNDRRRNVKYPDFYSKYACNELCEVEVYGCNVSIHKGEIFKKRCPKNCHEGQCDINTGHCLKCILGLQGPLCDQGNNSLSVTCNSCHSSKLLPVAAMKKCSDKLSYLLTWNLIFFDSRCIRMYFLIALVLLLVTRAFGSENIALGKPTWQEHPWPDPRYYSGDNAVDGLHTDRSLPGGQCSMSADNQSTATWRVDLGNVFSISHINIYYRTDNQQIPTVYARRMAGFYLYVSNTTSKETGHLCFHENQTKQEMILEDISINCSVSGLYVIYYNERRRNVKSLGFYSTYAYTELCEVEVYGCNVSIHNEEIGKNRCLKNCQEGQCDINTGHYLKCILGLQGPLCDQTCKDNDCTDPCDTNCVNQSCHQRTGNCFSKINITNKSIMTTSDAEKIEPTIIFIACGIVAAVIIIIIAIVAIVLYKRIKTTKEEHEETKRRKKNITESTTKNTFPNSRLYSSHTCVNIDIEDSLAQPEFSKSPSAHGEDTKNFSQSIELSGEDVDIDEKIHDENPYGDLYINEKPILDIAVDNLGNVIEENSRNEDDGFKKNYSTLLYGERYPCEIGKLPENITKNRFKTTFPYDHSRIKLANKESDYINANFIDGVRQENRYIATQGPTQNTVGDFWLLVWQEHVEQIVMLTNLMEGPKSKCFQYWPDLEETMDRDMFTLHTDTERHYACYSIRKLRLTYYEEQNESRTITQYHYTAWPDHGTPDPLCLLMFHNNVTRTKLGQLKVPTLVHCSAGIGRTGTYIAIDALYEEGQQKSKLNIAEYVRKMREKRMNMVQTYEQYKTIFLTLHEMFKAPVGVHTTNDYLKSQSAKSNHPAYVSSLRKEFQRLLSIRHQYSENDFKMALQYKSVSTSILPLDKYVVFLTSSVPKRGNYINAIFLPSFTSQNAFIATHYPTTGDPVDFIRLITDYESKVVVCMDPLCHVEFANEWLPTATESKTASPYTIKQQQELSTGFKCRKLEISKEKSSDEVWVVELIEPNSVLSQDNPETTSQILGLVSFVQNVKTDNPVTVVSSDGAALCGVFCAVYNLIQQLTMDEEIDVFSVVRLLQTRRPELCSTLEEYIMLHDALMRFLDKNK